MKSYVICIFSCVLYVGVSGLQLPYFIKKCAMSDPGINQCTKENANLAIPKLVEGIPHFGIPILAPLHLSTYQLDGRDVKMRLRDLNLYGLENFRIADVVFDFNGKKTVIDVNVPYLHIISDYTIINDNLFAPSNMGGGKLSISLVDNIIKVVVDFSTPIRAGKLYIMMGNILMKLMTQRTNYKFDQITTNFGGDNEEFVMKHSKILEGQLQPAILKLVQDTFRHVTSRIVDNVPVNELFDA